MNYEMDYETLEKENEISEEENEISESEEIKMPKINQDNELIKKAQAGDEEAITKVIKMFEPLIAYLIYKISKNPNIHDDLMQEGRLGILDTLKRYDFSKNIKFITYATIWIKQRIKLYIRTNTTLIKNACRTYDKVNNLDNARIQFEGEHGRSASVAELAKILKVPEKQVERTLSTPIAILVESTAVVDQENNETNLFTNIYDTDENIPEWYSHIELHNTLENALNILDDKTRTIIDLKYGLTNGIPKQDKEISQIVNMSRQRVQQLERIGLRRLGHNPQFGQKLRSFLEFLA